MGCLHYERRVSLTMSHIARSGNVFVRLSDRYLFYEIAANVSKK